MRVLLVNKYYYQRGGAERCFLDQERWLKADGHEPIVFSQASARNEASPFSPWFVPEARLSRLDLPGPGELGRLFWSPLVRRQLQDLVSRHKPDVALVHNVYHQLGPTVIATLRRLGLPSVMVLHDYKPICPSYSAFRNGRPCLECTGQRFFRAAQHRCGGSLLRGAALSAEAYWQWHVLDNYAKIHTFIAPSQYLKNALAKAGFAFRVELLRNAVERPRHATLPLSERRYIGYSGRLSEEKGLWTLLEAAKRLPDCDFRIAGDGPLEASLREAIRSTSLDNVRLLGHLRQPELRQEIRRWRIAVVPSLSPENCPYAVVDAMNQGAVVIASRIGGVPELVGHAGQLFEPGDSQQLARQIGELFPDTQKLEQLSSGAKAFIETQCSDDAYRVKLLRILTTAVAEGV